MLASCFSLCAVGCHLLVGVTDVVLGAGGAGGGGAGGSACGDGVENGLETDVDCGGGACPPCQVNEGCEEGTDCVEGVCVMGSCAAPTCLDGVQNGTETDVDCGGACTASPTDAYCSLGRHCATDLDCVAAGTCVGGACVPEPLGVFTPKSAFDFNPSPASAWIHGFGLVFDPVAQETLLVGGELPSQNAFDGVHAYDSAAKTWTLVTNVSAPPPVNARFALAHNGSVQDPLFVLFGGGAASGYPWEWNGNEQPGWVHRTDATGPLPDAFLDPAMTFHAPTGEFLLFGGLAGGPSPDLYRWADGVWSLASPDLPVPPGRFGHAFVHDVARQRSVLFGGAFGGGANQAYDDTWEWDGTGWQPLQTADPKPHFRANMGSFYDAHRGVVVVVGGGYYTGADVVALTDVWQYDGAGWRELQLDPSSASFEGDAYWVRAVYDGARARAVVVCQGDPAHTYEFYTLATACSADGDCGSGHCEDGLCCEAACGAGEACNTEATPGHCAPV